MSNHKSAEAAAAGESKTRALLSEDFWLLSRSVDTDGVDLIAQRRWVTDSEAIAMRHRPEVFAYIQAKQFRYRGDAKIACKYVDDTAGARAGFFVFMHSFDELGNSICWIFTACDVRQHWVRSSDGRFYRFKPGRRRTFSEFRCLDSKQAKQRVLQGMQDRHSRLRDFMTSQFFEIHSNVRPVREPLGEYLLIHVCNCPVVLYRDKKGHVSPLDPRRDLYEYSGYFTWGYGGTAPRFLAFSILGHCLSDRPPANEEASMLVEYLISRIDQNSDHEINAEMVVKALCGLPYFSAVSIEPVRQMYLDGKVRYAGLFGSVDAADEY